jgi:hypothetical protein
MTTGGDEAWGVATLCVMPGSEDGGCALVESERYPYLTADAIGARIADLRDLHADNCLGDGIPGRRLCPSRG